MTLFELLRQACAKRDIDLNLVHGQASRRESAKKDEGVLTWAHKVEKEFFESGPRDILWQPFPRDLRDAELIIIMQENRILSNYPLLLRRLWRGQKLAYWGHGVNFQSNNPNGLRERWKSLTLKEVDWWFAYTQTTVRILDKRDILGTVLLALTIRSITRGFSVILRRFLKIICARNVETPVSRAVLVSAYFVVRFIRKNASST